MSNPKDDQIYYTEIDVPSSCDRHTIAQTEHWLRWTIVMEWTVCTMCILWCNAMTTPSFVNFELRNWWAALSPDAKKQNICEHRNHCDWAAIRFSLLIACIRVDTDFEDALRLLRIRFSANCCYFVRFFSELSTSCEKDTSYSLAALSTASMFGGVWCVFCIRKSWIN